MCVRVCACVCVLWDVCLKVCGALLSSLWPPRNTHQFKVELVGVPCAEVAEPELMQLHVVAQLPGLMERLPAHFAHEVEELHALYRG